MHFHFQVNSFNILKNNNLYKEINTDIIDKIWNNSK